MKGTNMLQLLKEVAPLAYTNNIYAFGEYHHAVLDSEESKARWQQTVLEKFPDTIIENVTPNIEDCFINLMHAQKNGN